MVTQIILTLSFPKILTSQRFVPVIFFKLGFEEDIPNSSRYLSCLIIFDLKDSGEKSINSLIGDFPFGN